jgi:FlaA1/EpsC-like NDP-sugar epimerase
MLNLDARLQEQLLGRAVTDLMSSADRDRLRGQRVLITGAAGSIGSELARQLADCGVSRLTLMDHSEYGLFQIDSAIREAHPALDVVLALGDVTRRPDLRAACRAAQPHVVYHAAAYKHVTFSETALVPSLRVNVLGALEAACAAREAGARFVLISSDKAAEPRSVMGATKRLAELVVLAEAGRLFRPLVVRFGNVLGSSGSVAEIMLQRAAAGLPLPITDPDATRYFMTASEAIALVLKADLIGRRGEVFWLDMGDPVRIGDLAARIADHVRAAGGPAVGTEIIGLRPGEKLHEELTSQGLAMRPTLHARILHARQRPIARARIQAATTDVRRACTGGRPAEALAVLRSVVDGYVPSDAAIAAASMPVSKRQMSAA